MSYTIIAMIGFVIMSIAAIYLSNKCDSAKEENRRLKEQQHMEKLRLESQISVMSVQQDYAEAEAQRLFQEQMGLRMDAIDAGRAMLREAMRYRN